MIEPLKNNFSLFGIKVLKDLPFFEREKIVLGILYGVMLAALISLVVVW